jgi:CelD/BcsL family acetyltransferase involved in cellulose biosynthesis
LTFESLDPRAMGAADKASWSAIAANVPGLANPLHSLEFARVVARFRSDTRVAIARNPAGEAIAFFPHQIRPDGLARPLGAPFGDYQALVASPATQIDARAMLAATGIERINFSGLSDRENRFAIAQPAGEIGYKVELDTCGAAYLETIRQSNPKRYKNWRRLEHKTEREVGPVSFTATDTSHDHLATLLRWKSEQMQRTGVTNVLHPQWVRDMMHALLDTRDGAFSGCMMTLWAKDILLGGHFGIRSATVFHPWMAAINPEYQPFSPGQTYMIHAISAMNGLGLKVYDLGTGHAHYKGPFCNRLEPLGVGRFVTSGTSSQPINGIVGKISARLDHIASVELTLGGRIGGVAAAVAHAGTRLRSRSNDAATEMGA